MNIARLLCFLVFVVTHTGVWAKQCARDNLDIFIVLDGSQSINELNFGRLRKFLANLVGNFKVGEFESRVGLMQFSNQFRTVVEFDFGRHKTTKDVQDNIKNLVHQYGNMTYVGHALKLVNERVFPDTESNSVRPNNEKILLLVTDGHPHDAKVALREADKLKNKGVHLITIGAGTERWISKFKLVLNRIGSKPTHNQQEDFRFLQKITHKLVKDICGSKERQPAPPHKCFQEKKDIIIMVDGSKSIAKRNFLKVRSFLQDFLSRLDVGPSRLHVSVIQFSDSHKTSIEIALNQYTTVEDLVAAVAKIMYQQGTEADLFNALRVADLLVLNSASGDRVTAPDTIIIFTDGNYNDDGIQESLRKLRDRKTRIVSVGVGSKGKQFKQANVDALAIGTGDVYDLAGLQASVFLDDIAPSTCKMTSCTSAAPKCAPENQDILFLMDGSFKIGSVSFRFAQRFIKRLMSKMTIGRNTTHVGVIQYGSAGRVIHTSRLNKDNLRSQVGGQVSRMVYMDEKRDSDLAYAFSIASDMVLNPSDKSRQTVSKTIVVVTDGDIKDFSEVLSMAETLRNQGIRIIALSNGKNSKDRTYVSSLRLIASGPKEYYRLDNSQFNEVLKELQKTVCISEPQIPETCFSQKRRIFFAIDSSSGRGRKKFKEVKEFMGSLVTKLQIGLSNSQVGFLQYDDLTTASDRVVFEKNETVAETLQRIQKMKYRKGMTSYLGNALRIINREVFPPGADRHGEYKDLLIIIAHNEVKDAQMAFDETEKLKDKGVEIISIATGSRKKIDNIKSQLQVISTSSTNTHSADYTALWTILDEVVVNVCGLGQCTSYMARTCSPKKQDIVFVVDSSRSIGEMNYRRLLRFTKRLASRLDLAEGRTHLGMLQVGNRENSRFEFNMGEFPDRGDVLYMINEMTYIDSTTTFMGAGLKKIREEIFVKGGRDRPGIPNTVVLFADGESHDPKLMLDEATKLKAMGVKILAVGYGKNVTVHTFRTKNLMRMATNDRDVFSIDFKNNDLVLEEKIEVIGKHLVQVDCPRAFAPPVHCTQGSVDLFLLVDGSRSITASNFKLVKKFLRKLTSEFDVSKKATHIGLLQFSDEKSMSYEFALNEMNSNKEVKRAIRRMKYKAGIKTNTGDALRVVNRYIFNHRNGDRPEATDVLILFTDGQAHDFEVARRHAEEMKERNIRIITIAAGPDAKNPEAKLVEQMEALATDPLNVYKADFSELNDIVDKLIDIDCYIVPQGK